MSDGISDMMQEQEKKKRDLKTAYEDGKRASEKYTPIAEERQKVRNFLIERNILKPGYNDFYFTGDFGKVSLIELLIEYSNKKKS